MQLNLIHSPRIGTRALLTLLMAAALACTTPSESEDEDAVSEEQSPSSEDDTPTLGDTKDDESPEDESPASGGEREGSQGDDAARPPGDEDDDEASRDAGSARADAGPSRGRDAGTRSPDAGAPAPRPQRDGGTPSTPEPVSPPPRRDAGGSPPVDAGTGGGSAGTDELESLRQLCVDEINRYRATKSLPPLARATDREECSDNGAKLDGDTRRAHGSASAGGRAGANGFCPSHAQNTCPGWPANRGGVSGALTGCLEMMWDEGEPPVPVAECQKDFTGCYLKHGHYLNMSAAGTKRVACGFYKMSNGSWWMNQNFW